MWHSDKRSQWVLASACSANKWVLAIVLTANKWVLASAHSANKWAQLWQVLYPPVALFGTQDTPIADFLKDDRVNSRTILINYEILLSQLSFLRFVASLFLFLDALCNFLLFCSLFRWFSVSGGRARRAAKVCVTSRWRCARRWRQRAAPRTTKSRTSSWQSSVTRCAAPHRGMPMWARITYGVSSNNIIYDVTITAVWVGNFTTRDKNIALSVSEWLLTEEAYELPN